MSSFSSWPPVEVPAETTTTGSVTATTGSAVVVSTEPRRRLLTVFNDAPGYAWLKYGPTCASNDFGLKIAPGGLWEMPKPCHTGSVSLHWDQASGSAYFTQLV